MRGGGWDIQGLVAQHLDAIAADLALVVHTADQDAEGAVGVVPGEQRRADRVVLARLRIVEELRRGRDADGVEVQGIAGVDIDHAADAALGNVGFGALVDVQPSDDFGRQHQVVEAAARLQLVQDEPVGGGHGVAVQLRQVQGRSRAADRDPLAFAKLPGDGHARHALQ